MNDSSFRTKKESQPKESEKRMTNPYSIWRHSLSSMICVIPEIFDINSNKTEIAVGIVAVSLYHLERNMRWSGLELSSRHYCWTDMKNRDPASISDIVSYQICHNLVQFAQESVVRLSDPSPTRILAQIRELSQISHKKRCLFIYNGHGAPEPISASGIMLSPDESLGGDQITAKQLLKSMPLPSCFIFDADFSGLLFDDFSDPTLTLDRFGFFSCGPKENLPHRIGLPSDLFTSCLLTPAFVAMLWGSRQFYAFTSGGLHEFPLSYFSDENGVRPHLHAFAYEIERLLTTLVHAMAYSMIPPDMLYNCFYRDAKVGKLFVNFCLARRIGAEIGFKPMCYPEIPDFSQHNLWEYFDLYLDRVLLRLTQMDSNISVPQATIAADFVTFLADALIAIEHILDLKVFGSVPNEISMLPLILTEPSLAKAGIKAVTRFIDIRDDTIRNVICSGMMNIIVTMPLDDESLLSAAYCVAKMQCYALRMDSVIRSFTRSSLPLRLPLFIAYKRTHDDRYLLIALVLMAVGMNMEFGDSQNDLEPDLFVTVVDALGSEKPVVAFWAALYLSQFLEIVPDPCQIRQQFSVDQKIAMIEKSKFPELRAAAIAVYMSLFDHDNEEPSEIAARINKLGNDYSYDPSILVRTQLLICLQRLIENDAAYTGKFKDPLEAAHKYIEILSNDTHQEICDLATALKSTLENKIATPTGFTSPLLSGSIFAFMQCQFEHINEYTWPPICIPPNISNENNPKTTIINKISSLVEIDHYKHNVAFSTPPVFIDDMAIIGAADGSVVVRDFVQHNVLFTHPWQIFFSSAILSKNISNISPMSANSVCLSTNTGDVSIVNNIATKFPHVMESFSFKSKLDEKFVIKYSDVALFGTSSTGVIKRWDLHESSFGPDLMVSKTCINDFCVSNDTIAVGSDDFRIVDVRTPMQPQVLINTFSKVVNIHQSLQNTDEYISVLQNGKVISFDLRNPSNPKNWGFENASIVETVQWAPLTFIKTRFLDALDSQTRINNLLQSVYPTIRPDQLESFAVHPYKNFIEIIFPGGNMSTIKIC